MIHEAPNQRKLHKTMGAVAQINIALDLMEPATDKLTCIRNLK